MGKITKFVFQLSFMEQTEYDVFISYSSNDYFDGKDVIPDNVISQIKSHLQNAGISYWFDEQGIYEGDEYASRLVRAIKSSAVLLFVSSVNSNRSTWTRREIATAQKYGKIILPFKIDDSDYDDSVDIWLAGINAIEYNKLGDKALARLIEVLHEHLIVRRQEQELKRKKKEEQEELIRQKHENEQKELATNIELGASDLDTDEAKADTSRKRLLANVQKIEDPETRKRLSELIEESGPIYRRHKEERARLNEEISKLNDRLKPLPKAQEGHSNVFKVLLGCSLCACMLLSVLLMIAASKRVRLEEEYNQLKVDRIRELTNNLEDLSKNLTTVTFTSSDISALETFIKEHDELKDEPEIKTAEDKIKIAGSIISFCSGEDNAVDILEGASKEQEELIKTIKAMPELQSVAQNSKSLEDLKNELETAHAAEAQAAADAKSARQLFDDKCKALASLNCTISQLNDIIRYAENHDFTNDNRYKQASQLRRCIYKMTKRNSSGDPNPEQSGQDVLDTIKNRIERRDVPSIALEFFERLYNDTANHAALPFNSNYNSLAAISKAIYGE